LKDLKQHNTLRVLIAGGGTGGHIFPAIAIASALQKKAFDARILFVGAKGRMEMTRVPEAGYHIIGLDIAGLQRSLNPKNLLLPFKICKSLAAAKKIVKRFKPDMAIGVGGYASGPLIWAAAQQKVPVLIQEQNSFPGLTNRILGKKAEKICVAYEGMDKYLPKHKLFLTGNPVREEVVNIADKRSEAIRFFGFTEDRPILLVTGGSLGARTINVSIAEKLKKMLDDGIQIIWQTGTSYLKQASELSKKINAGKSLYIINFISRMDYAYAAADVVVSRAGAIAISELCVVRKPIILMPSPNVAEDHQTRNAMALVNQHAAVMVKDAEAGEKLEEEITKLIFDKNKQHKMIEKMAGLSYRNAADMIADVALTMC
jgi:UDP-N-acetylglucosamine--N-acetylmuramyl-(pentapeptide) pyrophosphoryl-undecaprenol N-acetylglucosamine transferase